MIRDDRPSQIQPLSIDDFRFVLHKTNLFALDLIITDSQGRVLLGLRLNAPAKGFWFVPGGRVYLNEKLRSAFERLLLNETGLSIDDVTGVCLHGLYEHIYDDNVFQDSGIGTHYIVAACRATLTVDFSPRHDAQHAEIKFMSVDSILADENVHDFTKFYFIENAPNKFL